MRNYLSFGGGVNSVALHLLLLDQGVEFESVFVHHGTDWPETYDYVAGFQWWLKQNGHKPITVLRTKTTLEDYCNKYRMVPNMRMRWCTRDFKVKPLYKYFTPPAFCMLGIDYGEIKRAKLNTNKGFENRFPLIEYEIDRGGCKEIIKKYGLPVPMKSGCWICPFQRAGQWKNLRHTHPDLFCKASIIEQNNYDMQTEKGKKGMYLSMRGVPLKTIVQEDQMVLFEQDEYPPCQCGL